MGVSKYENCYVAFLDILGFKELLEHNNMEEIRKIFEEIREFRPNPFVELPAHDQIKFHIMSDSIIVYVDADIQDSFISLVEVCYQIQISLLRREKPILLRGGIAKGNLYRDKDVIFGTGLSRANSLENGLASYPRIIFTGATLNEGLENSRYTGIWDNLSMFYLMDNDDLYYIDFLHITYYFKHLYNTETTDTDLAIMNYFEKLDYFVNDHLSYELNPSIRTKYLWLKRKINAAIDNTTELKNHFLELDNKKREEQRTNIMKRISEGDKS